MHHLVWFVTQDELLVIEDRFFRHHNLEYDITFTVPYYPGRKFGALR